MALSFTATLKKLIVEVLHDIISNGTHFRQILYGGWQPSWICWLLRTPIKIFITHAPLFRGGADHVYESPLGDSSFGNEYSSPIHALCDVTICIQTARRHNADTCCHNRSSLATTPSATPLPCSVPLNGMFHQDSAKQWNKLRIWKICNNE